MNYRSERHMRVGIVGSRGYPYVYSGYETFVKELAEELVRRGHNVTVYAHRELYGEQPAVVNGIRVVYVPGARSKTLSQLTHSGLATLHALIKPQDVLLFVNSANGPLGVLTTLMRQRTAINVDGMEWLRPKWKGLGSIYFRWASRQATKWFDAVVSDSVRMSEIYQQEFGVVPRTIAYGAYVPKQHDVRALDTWNLQPGDYYLVVGRLIPDNNLDLIVEGFKRTATTRKLVVVGDVPYGDEYAKRLRATSDPRLVWCGYVRERVVLDTLYTQSYAYFHGHGYGGTNPTLLEAMAAGCAILAIDTVFSREVLGDKACGWFFPKTAIGVAGLIEMAEARPTEIKEAGERARARVVRSYNWPDIVDSYEQLFHQLMAR